MYLGFLTSVIPKGRFQKALDATLVIMMMGGTTTLFYPAGAFHTSYVFICNQTMIHHGLMIVIGVVIMVSRLELTHKTFFLFGVPTYIVLVFIALLLDIGFYYLISKSEEFNMFYISPFQDGILPLITSLRTKAYPAMLVLYIILSTLYGYLLFLSGIITQYIFNKIRKYRKVSIEESASSKEKELCLTFLFFYNLL
jgi:hypothetical protein